MVQKSLRNVALLVGGMSVLVSGLARSAPVAGQDDANTKARIESAMAAGPLSITEHALILDNEMDAAGKFIVLREGNNGWTCFPDGPGTPGTDPMCLDETWMDWIHAIVAGTEPNTQVVGLAYMLNGGSDASNIDPVATEPEEGNEWITSPPHVMVIMPGDIDQSVFSTDPLSGGPWIMWPGTLYEHIMMPVAADEMVTMGAMGDMGEMASATPTP